MKPRVGWTAKLKKKLQKKDAHYLGGLVAGAKIIEFFGDVATKLCLREAGVEGLFRAYRSIEFLKPVYVGDTVEIIAKIIRVGNTSRTLKFEAHKLGSKKEIVCKA